MTINQTQVRIAEECLYTAKYLPKRIGDLQAYMRSVVPPSPGSVLKMVGRPVAKTPFDTSITERWAIRRACCDEAMELEAKMCLWYRLREFKAGLEGKEKEFVLLKYEKEKPVWSIVKEMGISERKYYRIRQDVVKQLWYQIRDMNGKIEIAVQ